MSLLIEEPPQRAYIGVGCRARFEHFGPQAAAAEGDGLLAVFLAQLREHFRVGHPVLGIAEAPPHRRLLRGGGGLDDDRFADTGTSLIGGGSESYGIIEGQPNSGIWKQEAMAGFKRGDWDCRMVAAYELTSTARAHFVKESLKVTERGEIVFDQTTESKIDRDLT